MKEKTDENIIRYEVRIIVLLIFIIIGVSIVMDIVVTYNHNEICIENGYPDGLRYDPPSEKGYITCCKDIYENHIRIDTICEAVKK